MPYRFLHNYINKWSLTDKTKFTQLYKDLGALGLSPLSKCSNICELRALVFLTQLYNKMLYLKLLGLTQNCTKK